MILAVVIQCIGGFLAAFTPSFWIFNLIRFVIGLSVGGTMVIGFVNLMEFTGAQYRQVVSAAYQVPFNLGHLLIPVYSYHFRDYKHYEMAGSGPTILLLCYFCFLPESARWLIAMKQTESAIKVLTKVAKV